ncbi:MAG: hypothetical protein ACU0A2_09290 [Cognatishimia sp.]|uniref:hypothetical protein n=1 Tax=Cognatishimia sp. TaxID=2211648 RepID=UPI0040580E02
MAPIQHEGFELLNAACFPEESISPALKAAALVSDYVGHVSIDPCLLNPHKPTSVATEIKDIIALRNEFLPARASEIVDQAGAFDHYFLNLLSVSTSVSKDLVIAIAFGIELAGAIGLKYKFIHMAARPVQRFPGLTPFLPTPPHPSFPSNHATQAFFVAMLLCDDIEATNGWAPYLKSMASRVAVNREIGGVHYRSDSLAGQALAKDIHTQLMSKKSFRKYKDKLLKQMSDLGDFDGTLTHKDIFAGRWGTERGPEV